MKIKAPYLFGLKTCGIGLAVGYGGVFLANMIVTLISGFTISGSHSNDFLRGMLFGMNLGGLSWIFMLMFSIVLYKQSMLYYVQNGRSRSTVLASLLLMYLTMAVVLGTVNICIDLLDSNLNALYSLFLGYKVGFTPVRMLWEIVSLLSISLIGMTASAIFYRLTKLWRLIVAVGVPAVLIILVGVLTLLQVRDPFLMLLGRMFGVYGGAWHPGTMILTMLAVDVVLCGALYLLGRNVPIRK